MTAALMHYWNLTGAVPNPPLARRLPITVAHFRQCNTDMAYVALPGANESIKQFKRRLYGVLRTMTAKIEDIAEMRIIRKYPDTLWERVWKNLHAAVVPDSVKSTWYRAIHDIFPTKERLAAIGLTDMSSCVHCGHIDTLQHRVVECRERPVIWHWIRERIVTILRMDPRRIPVE